MLVRPAVSRPRRSKAKMVAGTMKEQCSGDLGSVDNSEVGKGRTIGKAAEEVRSCIEGAGEVGEVYREGGREGEKLH